MRSYDEAELKAHLLNKHRDSSDLAWQLAKQRDRLEGFAWRGSALPALDAESDGRCPLCGRNIRGAGEAVFRDHNPDLFDQLLPDRKRGHWDGPFDGALILLYCLNDGSIVRVMRN
jgi:hypothetical protein